MPLKLTLAVSVYWSLIRIWFAPGEMRKLRVGHSEKSVAKKKIRFFNQIRKLWNSGVFNEGDAHSLLFAIAGMISTGDCVAGWFVWKSLSKCTPVEIFNNETSSCAERLYFVPAQPHASPLKCNNDAGIFSMAKHWKFAWKQFRLEQRTQLCCHIKQKYKMVAI